MPRPEAASVIGFGGIEIAYDPRVLEPRVWTHRQAAWAAELAQEAPAGAILELCSGAGHIGLLAARLARRRLVAVDADPIACAWTRANAERNGLAARVEVRCADLEAACAEGEVYPVVVADPPWVPTSEVSQFPADPVLAIDGGPDGLALVRGCLAVVAQHLHPDGVAVLQAGPDQEAAVRAELPTALEVLDVLVEQGRGSLLRIGVRNRGRVER